LLGSFFYNLEKIHLSSETTEVKKEVFKQIPIGTSMVEAQEIIQKDDFESDILVSQGSSCLWQLS
jgi:hypothetical protein